MNFFINIDSDIILNIFLLVRMLSEIRLKTRKPAEDDFLSMLLVKAARYLSVIFLTGISAATSQLEDQSDEILKILMNGLGVAASAGLLCAVTTTLESNCTFTSNSSSPKTLAFRKLSHSSPAEGL